MLVHTLCTEVIGAVPPGLDAYERGATRGTGHIGSPASTCQDSASQRRVVECPEPAPLDHSLLPTGSCLRPAAYCLSEERYSVLSSGLFSLVVS